MCLKLRVSKRRHELYLPALQCRAGCTLCSNECARSSVLFNGPCTSCLVCASAGFAQGVGLAAVDMAGLLQDSFALAESGLLSIQTHLSLLR